MRNWKSVGLIRIDREKKINETEATQLMKQIETLAEQAGLRQQEREKIPSGIKAEIESKAVEEEVLKADGSRPLSADWDIGDSRKIRADKIQARNSAGLSLYEDGGAGIFIEDGGFVGIGTENPSAYLHVVGTTSPYIIVLERDDVVYLDVRVYSDDPDFPTMEFQRARGNAASPSPVQNGDTVGVFYFEGRNAIGSFSQSVKLKAIVDGSVTINKVPTAFEIITGDSTFEKIAIHACSDGKVGILTNNPGGTLGIKDNNTYIDVDGSGNMTFTDAITGTRLLKNIGCPNYKFIKATNQSEGDLHLSAATWNVSKALIKVIRVVTSSTDWDLWILQNDNGYAADDANIPKMQVVETGNGNMDRYLDLPYEDEDASGEVHLYYVDNSGSNTANIYIIGYELI